MADSAGSDLTRHTAEVPLIDQHVHGCWLTEGNRRRFENALNEANTEPLADFDSIRLTTRVRRAQPLRSHPWIA